VDQDGLTSDPFKPNAPTRKESPMSRSLIAGLVLMSSLSAAQAEDVVLYGAGSLRDVMTAIVADYRSKTSTSVRTAFGPSGLMREKIEAGDGVDLFASADMGHPLKLQKDGRATSVVMFTRNRLCAYATPDVGLTSANFVEKMLGGAVKLGTSTPLADPSGDYTWQMFRLIERARAGAFALLDAKAKKIVGGTTNPSDADPVASAFGRGDINVMIGYCSGAEQRRRAAANLQVLPIPEPFATGPEYGLAMLSPDKLAAVKLAFAILSQEGQEKLAQYGFHPVGLQAKP
jgi:molybdate transport system substrate-binding protein